MEKRSVSEKSLPYEILEKSSAPLSQTDKGVASSGWGGDKATSPKAILLHSYYMSTLTILPLYSWGRILISHPSQQRESLERVEFLKLHNIIDSV